jgi:eukaryotic-like serine/threonine-protein kinase
MTIKLQCPHPGCGKSYRVSEEHVGRKTRCPACQREIIVGDPALESDAMGGTRGAQDTRQSDRPAKDTHVTAQRIGRFEIREQLGAGAFGEVYRAHDRTLDREVALKVPRPGTLASARAFDRFLREGKAAAQLRHPHIVPVYDAGQADGRHYIASAFIRGKPLADVVEDGPLEFHRAATIVRSLADALAYAHEQGVVHRDIKPDNVMIDQSGQPHIMDFGLARVEESTDKMTQDGTVLGTAAYMAPEQARGELDQVGPASDQYSLGVVLYELLTGQTPFSGPPQIVLFNVLEKEPPAPRTLRADIPLDLETICQRAMAKESVRRYGDCGALAEDLRRYLDNEPISARRLNAIERFQRWRRRNPVVAGLTAALFAVLAVGIVVSGLLAWQSSQRATAARTAAKRADDEAKRAGEQETLAKAQSKQLAVRLGESYFEQGTHWCDVGDPARGLLSFAAAWRATPEDAADLRRVTLFNLGAWSRQLHTVEAACDCGTQYCNAAAISPDGRWLATTAYGGTTRVFDTATGETKMESPLVGSGLWFYDEGRSLLVSGDGVHFLDVTTGTEKRAALPQQSSFNTLVVRPEANRLITGPTRGTLQLYELASGQAIGAPIQLGRVTPMQCFADQGLRIVAVGGISDVSVWDVQTGQQRGPTLSTAIQRSLKDVSPDGSLVAVESTRGSLELRSATDMTVVGSPLVQNANVNCAAFSPDGRYIASGGSDGFVRVWDVASRQPVGPPLEHGTYLLGLTFRLDGRQLVSSGADDLLKVWDVLTGEQVGQGIPCLYDTRGSQFTADGSRLLVHGSDPTARLWRLAAEPDVKMLPRQFLADSPVFAPNSEHFVGWGTFDMQVQWDAATGRRLHDDSPLGGMQQVRAISDSGSLVLGEGPNAAPMLWRLGDPDHAQPLSWSAGVLRAGGFSEDERWLVLSDGAGTMQRYRTSDGQTEGPLLETRSEPLGLRLSANGDRVVVGESDGTVRVFAADGSTVGKPIKHPHSNPRARFRPGSEQVLTYGGDGIARLWDTDVPEMPIRTFGSPGELTAVAFDATGARLLLADKAKTVRVWDVESGAAVAGDLPTDAQVMVAALAPGGQTALGLDERMRLVSWDVATGRRVAEYADVPGMQFSGDGAKLTTAVAQASGAWLWDRAVTAGKNLFAFARSVDTLGTAFSPDGETMAVASGNGTVRIWRVGGETPLDPTLAHDQPVTLLVFNPNGQILLTAAKEECRLWEVPSGRLLHKLPHPRPVTAIAFSRDGRQALIGAGSVFVWDVASGEAVRGETAPPDGAAALRVVTFSPDGDQCLTQNATDIGQLWDVATGRAIGGPLPAIDQGQGNGQPVAAFSADGRRLITAATDNSARLWDAATGQPTARPLQHLGEVWAVGFNGTGALAVTGSMDGSARLWDAASGLPLGPPMRAGATHVAGLSPDGATVVTAHVSRTDWDAGEPSRVWTVPRPAQERDGPTMERWAQVLTGLELLPEGNFALLPAAAWNERRAGFVEAPSQP